MRTVLVTLLVALASLHPATGLGVITRVSMRPRNIILLHHASDLLTTQNFVLYTGIIPGYTCGLWLHFGKSMRLQ